MHRITISIPMLNKGEGYCDQEIRFRSGIIYRDEYMHLNLFSM